MAKFENIPVANMIEYPNVSGYQWAPVGMTHYLQLSRFAGEVQKIFPACSFGKEIPPQSSDGHVPRTGPLGAVYVEYSVYVYHKHKSLIMGEIGVREYDDNDRENDFFVSSRKITHKTYGEYSDRYSTTLSRNMGTAVRNVKKYIMEVPPIELAIRGGQDIRRHWGGSAKELREAVKAARSAVVQTATSDMLMMELKAIVNSGYQFVDPAFGATVDKFLSEVAECAELERDRSQRVSMVSVEVSPQTGNSLFSVARTEDIDSWAIEWEPKGTFVGDTLDPDIAGKLSVLSMCHEGQWVDGVGVKHLPTVFYVVH
tara:strand:+ start:161 stop:1102 length:942 start_codon:yes stop_codon:yes gene_type:complete